MASIARFAKSFLWILVQIFFKLYFGIFGKPSISTKLQKTLNLYKGSDFFQLFSLIRVWDAPFEAVNKAVPRSGTIIDLGCGDGTQSNFLAISSSSRKVLGVEINKDRVSEANKGLKNTSFKVGDIRTVPLPKADAIILTHVLHHLPKRSDQEKIIRRLKRILKKKGKLVIVEIIERPRLKYYFTWITDAFIVPILFEHKFTDFNFHYRRESQWMSLLKKNGFRVTATYPHKGMPFSHVLFVCEK